MNQMETQNEMTQLQSSPYASIEREQRQLTMSNGSQEKVLLCEVLVTQPMLLRQVITGLLLPVAMFL